MINTIASTVKTKLQELDIFERFGGITRAYTRKNVTLPISFDVDGEQCWEQGTHKDLVPNDRFKSVAYLEQRTPVAEGLSDRGAKRKPSYTVGLRLVCWVNLKKLGYNSPTVTDRIILTVQKKLRENSRVHTVTAADFTGAQVEIQAMNVVNATKEDIFSQYSHAEFNRHLLFPFAFFAIDMTAVLHLSDSCFAEVTAQTPIEC